MVVEGVWGVATVGIPVLLLLVLVAFTSGIGITTVGPGGIFVTIALYSLTSMPSTTVAGTAHATFIATGLVGSAAFAHSGDMDSTEARVMAVVLSLSSVLGAVAGTVVNAAVSRALFGLLLGGMATTTGITIVYRERYRLSPMYSLDVSTSRGTCVLALLGLVLGLVSGFLGVGGPVLAVPVLVLVGVPMLLALAVAQVQSVFIAVFATAGYFANGYVSLPLAVFIGGPLLLGVVVGWQIAHLIDPTKLKMALGVVLVAVGPLLAL